ncbi:hypothetical protein [Streptomyces sp. NPDC002758]
MTAHHAIEIVLTRPATVEELRRAHSAARLAANTDRTRLLALQRAKSPGRALRALRRQLDALLPIDVLTSHYPDQYGQVLLNLTLSNTARTAIRRAAATRGQRPQGLPQPQRGRGRRPSRTTTPSTPDGPTRRTARSPRP